MTAKLCPNRLVLDISFFQQEHIHLESVSEVLSNKKKIFKSLWIREKINMLHAN